jgi:hypothetical protein
LICIKTCATVCVAGLPDGLFGGLLTFFCLFAYCKLSIANCFCLLSIAYFFCMV